MNNEFQPVNDGEIISLNHQDIGRQLNLASHGFDDVQVKSEQFAKVIRRRLNIKDAKGQTLFKEGIGCEVFKSGSTGLQKGRLRARLVMEFCPDELINDFPELSQDKYFSNDEI
ncbi:KGK domain-containing protein [Calothrix sp. CCY 0018]|uniref:KGK domain-containing protein n=1 Tax=Calothrix sp. CCY 0018 TaxID=3103864 RepID=UPI0039C68C1C